MWSYCVRTLHASADVHSCGRQIALHSRVALSLNVRIYSQFYVLRAIFFTLVLACLHLMWRKSFCRWLFININGSSPKAEYSTYWFLSFETANQSQKSSLFWKGEVSMLVWLAIFKWTAIMREECYVRQK